MYVLGAEVIHWLEGEKRRMSLAFEVFRLLPSFYMLIQTCFLDDGPQVCDDIMNQLGMTKRARVLKSSFNRPEIHLSVRFKV